MKVVLKFLSASNYDIRRIIKLANKAKAFLSDKEVTFDDKNHIIYKDTNQIEYFTSQKTLIVHADFDHELRVGDTVVLPEPKKISEVGFLPGQYIVKYYESHYYSVRTELLQVFVTGNNHLCGSIGGSFIFDVDHEYKVMSYAEVNPRENVKFKKIAHTSKTSLELVELFRSHGVNCIEEQYSELPHITGCILFDNKQYNSIKLPYGKFNFALNKSVVIINTI